MEGTDESITAAGEDGMHVAELWRYPVKSMAGERLESTWIGVPGIPGDRVLYVVDGRGEILSARTKPALLGHHATVSEEREILVDGLPWQSPEVGELVRAAAGPEARLVEAAGPERFDILPLLVATDGAIEAFGHDGRRLRPNVVVGGVEGLAERGWERTVLGIGDVLIGLFSLRGRCIMTTFDPDTLRQDVDVLRSIRARFDGTFALNAWAGRPGRVAVGDAVTQVEGRMDLQLPQTGRYA